MTISAISGFGEVFLTAVKRVHWLICFRQIKLVLGISVEGYLGIIPGELCSIMIAAFIKFFYIVTWGWD